MRHLQFSALCALLCFALPAWADYQDPLETVEFRKPYMGVTPSFELLEVYDPFESVNRRLFKFNYLADEYVLLPIVRGYTWLMPSPVREGVSNVYNNLAEIPTLVNLGLQLQGEDAAITAGRVGVNTTVGLLGLFDVATPLGLQRQDADFGQTLGVWGVNEGPFLMLPILGPSNLRDTAGIGADMLINKEANFLGLAETSSHATEIALLKAVDARYNVKFRYGEINSPFSYDLLRLLWTQQRELRVMVRQEGNDADADQTAASGHSRMVPTF